MQLPQSQQYIHNIRRNNCLPSQSYPTILSNNNNNNNNTKYHIVPIPIKSATQSLSCLRNNRVQQCYSLPLSSSPPQTIFELQPESDEQSFDAINIVNPLFSYSNGNSLRHHTVEIVNDNKIELNEDVDTERLHYNYSAKENDNMDPITLNDCSHQNFDEINYADDAAADAIDEDLIHTLR